MKLLMVGPTPKPYTGQSVSFEKLKSSFEFEGNVEVYHVETSPRQKLSHVTGKLGLSRCLDTLRIFVSFVFYLLFKRPDSIYLTKGSTTFGFLRDYCLISFKRIICPNAKFIIHLKGGNYDSFYESSLPKVKKMIRSFLEQSDHIIVLGDSLVKMYDFMPTLASKITVVENALTFDIAPVEKTISSDKVSFLFLSNLIYSKGYTHLAQVAERLYKSGVCNFEIVFAGQFMGSPDDPVDLEDKNTQFSKLINDPDVNYIKYLGVLSGKDKEAALNNADVLALPTRYHVEGQPVCIIEAMAYSCAILATKYRSIPDLIDGTNGKFVEYSNIDDLAAAMQSLIENKSQLKSMCSISKSKFESNFTWDCHYSKIKKIILCIE